MYAMCSDILSVTAQLPPVLVGSWSSELWVTILETKDGYGWRKSGLSLNPSAASLIIGSTNIATNSRQQAPDTSDDGAHEGTSPAGRKPQDFHDGATAGHPGVLVGVQWWRWARGLEPDQPLIAMDTCRWSWLDKRVHCLIHPRSQCHQDKWRAVGKLEERGCYFVRF